MESNQLITFELMSNDTPNLQTLELLDNSLSAMPVFIGQLHSPETLDLESNAIEIILPDAFENITNIRNLSLSKYKITESVSNVELSHLSELNLANNRLVQVPHLEGHFSSNIEYWI